MDFASLPEFLKPRLRLFLSADLVGSTALKQSGNLPLSAPREEDNFADLGASWFNDIGHFYRSLEIEFTKQWEHYCSTIAKKYDWPTGDSPELWKSNGDDLIYVKELRESRECFAAICCWLRAIVAYRNKLKTDNPRLDVKAAAWVAGFPIANSEVVFTKNIDVSDIALGTGMPKVHHYYLLDRWYSEPDSRALLVKDYIGPSIDTGFRVAGKATPRQFMVSLEVALLLSLVTPPEELDNVIRVRYEGKESLKGVMGGVPYPLFWIDAHLSDDLTKLEDALLQPNAPNRDDARRFCVEFINRHDRYIFRPFLRESTEPLLSLIPENYESLLTRIAETWRKEKRKFDIEVASMRGEAPAEDGANAEEVDQDAAEKFSKDIPLPP